MIRFPNAKINLGLNIVSRRQDGYHNIETVFYPIQLTDILEIVPSQAATTSFTSYGRTIDCPVEKNLVMKSYRLMEKEFGLPAVDIFLHKNIPDGAGLGGGSSDAANTLIMLNDIFSLNLPETRLAEMAATLGADCPFFIYNRPMIATGIGEILSPINVNLSGKTMLLVKPEVSVPTAAAYSRVIPKLADTPLTSILSSPIDQWQATLKNDFELSVFASYPQLEEIKSKIIERGACYAAMSGSGSSIFGIYESANMAECAKTYFEYLNSYIINL